MNDFKLIAIRPLKGCHEDYRKALKEDEIYQFYNEYEVKQKEIDGRKEVISVKPKSSHINNLYNLHSLHNNVAVNVSAVVGKNGSGKSTLLELLYLSIYVVATKQGMLTPNMKTLEQKIEKLSAGKGNPKINAEMEKLQKHSNGIGFIYSNLKVEVYYAINDAIFCLHIDNNGANIELKLGNEQLKRNYKIKQILSDDKIEMDDFFYSIAINYSLYGLNSAYLGDWITQLFHKNDAYKTPVVINPMRKMGNIDVNVETHLAQSRLLANLVDKTMTGKKIVGENEVSYIVFKLREEKIKKNSDDSDDYEEDLDIVTARVMKLYGGEFQFFNAIYKAMLSAELNTDSAINTLGNNLVNMIAKYAIKKVIKLSYKYDDYREAVRAAVDKGKKEDIDSYLTELATDKSHITLKVRQILNTVRFGLLMESDFVKVKDKIWEAKLSLHELKLRINNATNRPSELNNIEMVPVAFFEPEIHIDKEGPFNALSSGEQQLAHAVQSILYHLININSVFEAKDKDGNLKRLSYQNVNLILDEIELYFHPEFQRDFIQELLQGIGRLKLIHINAINILFSTHSPFILSDIPNTNLLRLHDGEVVSYNPEQLTFGANIHDLLQYDFFLQAGFMGKWAKSRIEETIRFLNWKKLEQELNKYGERDELSATEQAEKVYLQKRIEELDIAKISDERTHHLEIIKMIGEPVIKGKMMSMYRDVYSREMKQEFAMQRIRDIAKDANLDINF